MPGSVPLASEVVMVPMLVATVMRMPSSTVLPNASTITPLVTVLVVIPSAMILPGTGVSDMLPAAGPGCKMMLLSPVIIDNRVPVGDSTLRTAVPLTVPVSVLVTTPETVVPLPVIAPSVETTLTVVPSGTRFPLESLIVTVRIEESVPFATKLLFASNTVTVNILLSTPSATTVVFDAEITALAGTPGSNEILVSPVTVASAVPDGDSTPRTAF